MRARSLRSSSVALVLACCSGERPVAPPTSTEGRIDERTSLGFQDMPVGQSPRSFTSALTGGGAPGTWLVQPDPSTTDARVLAQTSTDDTDYRFPLCVLEGYAARNTSVSVRFQAREGAVDRAAGLVVRYRDERNYYVARANALEDNVRLYRVVDGERRQFAGAEHPVSAGAWHALRLDASGRRFAVFLDGELLFTAEDDTLSDAGRIGLWTKADSVTWFDDLCCGPVPGDSPVHAAR